MDLIYGAYRKDEYEGMEKEEIPVRVSLKDLLDFCLYLDKELQFKYQSRNISRDKKNRRECIIYRFLDSKGPFDLLLIEKLKRDYRKILRLKLILLAPPTVNVPNFLERKRFLLRIIKKAEKYALEKPLQQFTGSVTLRPSAKLKGKYRVGKYILLPCKKPPEHFVVIGEVSAIGEGIARQAIYDKGKFLSAWLSLITDQLVRSVGDPTRSEFWPQDDPLRPRILPKEEKRSHVLSRVYGIDEEPIEGKCYDTPRPDLRNRISRRRFELEMPSDLHVLFRLTESLSQEDRENFKHSCFAYQTALSIWQEFPSLSMLCLFMAIEALLPRVSIPCDQICDGCKALLKEKGCKKCRKWVTENCPNVKKINQRIIDFISNKLDISKEEVKTMIPYDKRSKLVHKAIVFGYELSSRFPFSHTLSMKDIHPGSFIFTHSELEGLRLLVREALIEWLRKSQSNRYRGDS